MFGSMAGIRGGAPGRRGFFFWIHLYGRHTKMDLLLRPSNWGGAPGSPWEPVYRQGARAVITPITIDRLFFGGIWRERGKIVGKLAT